MQETPKYGFYKVSQTFPWQWQDYIRKNAIMRKGLCTIIGDSQSFSFWILCLLHLLLFKAAEKQFWKIYHTNWSISLSIPWIIGFIRRLNRLNLAHLVLYNLPFTYMNERMAGSGTSAERPGPFMAPPLQFQDFANSLSYSSLTFGS